MSDFTNNLFMEAVAYESLWLHKKASFKSLAELFGKRPGARPSQYVAPEVIMDLSPVIENIIIRHQTFYKYCCLLNGEPDYPARLRDAKEPVELLYYSGDTQLLRNPYVAVIGTRNSTSEGLKRTERLVSLLVQDGFTIVSGLARGIDTQAHQAALKAGGKTIAVVGTPLDQFYPAENKTLQELIAKQYLLISQVPFYKYRQQDFDQNNAFFPERNKTMVALSDATVIVEASDRSGTLIAASAALDQGRKLFIMENCIQNPNNTWTGKLLARGARRLRNYEDLKIDLTSITRL